MLYPGIDTTAGVSVSNLYDGYTTSLNAVEGTVTTASSGGVFPYMIVQLDDSYTDIEMLSVWGGGFLRLSSQFGHLEH